jgi:hypothetical protein
MNKLVRHLRFAAGLLRYDLPFGGRIAPILARLAKARNFLHSVGAAQG